MKKGIMVIIIIGTIVYMGGFIWFLGSAKVASKVTGIGKIVSPYKRYYMVMDKTDYEKTLWYGFWPCVYLHQRFFNSTFIRASDFFPSPAP